MKIVILQGYALPIPPKFGGAVEKIWFVLGKYFGIRGHEVIHISRLWSEFPKSEFIGSVKHQRIKGYDFKKNVVISKYLDLIYTIRAIRYIPVDTNIVVSNTFWAPIILPIFRGAKIVVSVERMPKGQMRLYKYATRLRAPSTAVAEAIKKEIPQKRHDQIVIIPNPIPFEDQDPIDLNRKEKIILYCGRIHPEKGLELLEETAKNLPEDWRIQIIGPWKEPAGGGEKYFHSLQKIFDYKPVEFIGPVYNQFELTQFYTKASIFIYPTIAEKGEAMPLAPLEAMSHGCVPIVSNLDCFKDYIKPSINGLIFNTKSSEVHTELRVLTNEIILNNNKRTTIANKALEVRNTHSPDRIANMMINLFYSIWDQIS
jgi:glycosyltransferase involved in cell wall biosynthesis